MGILADQQVANWLHVLTLSNVKPGENVVVATTEASHAANVDCAMRAAAQLGARVTRLDIPPAGSFGQRASVQVTPLTGHRLAVDLLKSADMVIDLIGILHSPEQLEVIASGTRMLMVIEPPDVLARLVPEASDKGRVMAADKALHTHKIMHVTSKAGTDLTMEIGQFGSIPEYGFVDEPGHWDHWPSCFTSTFPNENSGEGRVVLDTGDMLFPFKMYVQSPITMELEGGFIKSIEGGFDAKYLREHMESFKDPNVFAISHIGWGLQHKANWRALGLRDKVQSHGMDARGFYGNFLFSTGPNAEIGGSNHAACHIDIPMGGCSVTLDGIPMVTEGVVIPADQRV